LGADILSIRLWRLDPGKGPEGLLDVYRGRSRGLSIAAAHRAPDHKGLGALSWHQDSRDRVIRLLEVLLHGGTHVGGWTAKTIHEAVLTTFGLSEKRYRLNQLRYDLRKLKGRSAGAGRIALCLPPHHKRRRGCASVPLLPQTAVWASRQQSLPSSTRHPILTAQQARGRLSSRRCSNPESRRFARRRLTRRLHCWSRSVKQPLGKYLGPFPDFTGKGRFALRTASRDRSESG
jgi:hypothetical protein